MGGKASREKGKIGERMACKALGQVIGGEWRRSLVQSRRGAELPDIICDDYPDLGVEVKRQKRPSIPAALAQAINDCDGTSRIPLALCKPDRGIWTLTLRLEDLGALMQALRDRG